MLVLTQGYLSVREHGEESADAIVAKKAVKVAGAKGGRTEETD